MKDSLKKGLIIGAAGSAICVLWHHLLTKKMMQSPWIGLRRRTEATEKCVCPGSPEMIETN